MKIKKVRQQRKIKKAKLRSENQNVKNKNGKGQTKNQNRKVKWRSENQNVKSKNGKGQNKNGSQNRKAKWRSKNQNVENKNWKVKNKNGNVKNKNREVKNKNEITIWPPSASVKCSCINYGATLNHCFPCGYCFNPTKKGKKVVNEGLFTVLHVFVGFVERQESWIRNTEFATLHQG